MALLRGGPLHTPTFETYAMKTIIAIAVLALSACATTQSPKPSHSDEYAHIAVRHCRAVEMYHPYEGSASSTTFTQCSKELVGMIFAIHNGGTNEAISAMVMNHVKSMCVGVDSVEPCFNEALTGATNFVMAVKLEDLARKQQ